MDVLVFRYGLFLLIPPALGIVFAIYIQGKMKGKESVEISGRKISQEFVGMICFLSFGSLLLFTLLSDQLVWSVFKKNLNRPHESIRIMHSGGTVEIEDEETIATVRRAFVKADKKMAHHSSPRDWVILHLPDSGYSYAIAKDSERVNEYWLTWIGHGSSDEWKEIHQFAQIDSAALSQLLATLNLDWFDKREYPDQLKSMSPE